MVKNLIFDFGAVLIPIDEEKSEKAFTDLGALPELKEQTSLFKDLETGKLSGTEFAKSLQPYFFRKKIMGRDIAQAWNAICYTAIPEETINFLKTLNKKGYNLFLLSNTNALHISEIKKHSGPFTYNTFLKQFTKVYYSHEVGLRKPDKKIFELVLKENELTAEQCFFTDDKAENVKAARKMGINTFHFLPDEHDLSRLKKHIQKL